MLRRVAISLTGMILGFNIIALLLKLMELNNQSLSIEKLFWFNVFPTWVSVIRLLTLLSRFLLISVAILLLIHLVKNRRKLALFSACITAFLFFVRPFISLFVALVSQKKVDDWYTHENFIEEYFRSPYIELASREHDDPVLAIYNFFSGYGTFLLSIALVIVVFAYFKSPIIDLPIGEYEARPFAEQIPRPISSLRNSSQIVIPQTPSMAEQIKELNDMMEQGMLTKAEFTKAKKRILDGE